MNSSNDNDDEDKLSEDKSDNTTSASYAVGYKRPPVHTRFKPGVPGNPKGRPKGRRNLKTDLEEEFSERVTLRDGDRTVRMTKQRALVKSTVARAIKGDPRAQTKAFELLLRAFGFDNEVGSTTSLEEKDNEIITGFLKRSKELNRG